MSLPRLERIFLISEPELLSRLQALADPDTSVIAYQKEHLPMIDGVVGLQDHGKYAVLNRTLKKHMTKTNGPVCHIDLDGTLAASCNQLRMWVNNTGVHSIALDASTKDMDRERFLEFFDTFIQNQRGQGRRHKVA